MAIKLSIRYTAPPLVYLITCASGGDGVRPRETEPFIKAVIRVLPALVSSLHVVAGLLRI